MLGHQSADGHMIENTGSQVAVQRTKVIANHLMQVSAEPFAKGYAESVFAFPERGSRQVTADRVPQYCFSLPAAQLQPSGQTRCELHQPVIEQGRADF